MKRDEYAIMYRVEDRHWWYVGLRAMLEMAWNRFAPTGPVRMLDVGCGTGANLELLKRKAARYGIDFSIDAVKFCRERGHATTAVAAATALPFADASFDAVVSCDVLCHQSIRDKSQPLREVHRVLKPGGIAIVNLPAYQWLHSSHDVHVQTNKRFSTRETMQLLKHCGFECSYATYWNTLLFPVIVLARLWRKLRPLATSDLDGASGESLAPIFAAILGIERKLLRAGPLPFGLSLFVVARRRN